MAPPLRQGPCGGGGGQRAEASSRRCFAAFLLMNQLARIMNGENDVIRPKTAREGRRACVVILDARALLQKPSAVCGCVCGGASVCVLVLPLAGRGVEGRELAHPTRLPGTQGARHLCHRLSRPLHHNPPRRRVAALRQNIHLARKKGRGKDRLATVFPN